MVPDGWGVHKLEDIAKYRRGSFPQPYGLDKWFDDDGHSFVQVYDVDTNLKLKDVTKAKISDLAVEKSVLAPRGTVLVTLQGSIGRVAITQYPAYVDRTLLIIKELKLEGDLSYLAISLQELFAEEKKRAPGGTIKTITKAALNNFKIFWPPRKEQQKIAKILSTWDEAIATTEQLLANSEQQKKALMQQLLTGKKRLPGFQAEWEEMPLGNIANVSKGKALSSKDLEVGEYPVVAGGKMSPYTHNAYTHERAITISASGAYAGYVGYHEYKFWASDCSVIEGSDKADIRFLEQLLIWRQNNIYALQSGGAQPHVYPKELKSMRFYIPSFNEQKAIARVLVACAKEEALLARGVETLKQEKKALMQQLLTGKRRVKVDEAERATA